MLVSRSTLLFAAALLAGSASLLHADTDWAKTYSVTAKPSLTVNTGDSSVEIGSCGACREVRIRVEWRDSHASNYTLTESQTGNHVEFALHEKLGFGIHIDFGNRRAPHVIIETPQSVDLDARTSDGSLNASGISGDLQLRTSDGSLTANNVSGALRLTSSDGSIHVEDASGTLESHSSDGNVRISGKFSSVQVKGSDGSLDLTLAPGSRLTMASSVQTSDGSVKLHLPHSLSADVDVHSSDGTVRCNLPLSMEGYNSAESGKKGLRGKLGGGGVPLTIRTDDGNVSIDASGGAA